MQRNCHWCLRNGGNSNRSHEPKMQLDTRPSESIVRPTSHNKVMAAIWRPYMSHTPLAVVMSADLDCVAVKLNQHARQIVNPTVLCNVKVFDNDIIGTIYRHILHTKLRKLNSNFRLTRHQWKDIFHRKPIGSSHSDLSGRHVQEFGSPRKGAFPLVNRWHLVMSFIYILQDQVKELLTPWQ